MDFEKLDAGLCAQKQGAMICRPELHAAPGLHVGNA